MQGEEDQLKLLEVYEKEREETFTELSFLSQISMILAYTLCQLHHKFLIDASKAR